MKITHDMWLYRRSETGGADAVLFKGPAEGEEPKEAPGWHDSPEAALADSPAEEKPVKGKK